MLGHVGSEPIVFPVVERESVGKQAAERHIVLLVSRSDQAYFVPSSVLFAHGWVNVRVCLVRLHITIILQV
jgi:hypothetical protein